MATSTDEAKYLVIEEIDVIREYSLDSAVERARELARCNQGTVYLVARVKAMVVATIGVSVVRPPYLSAG
jgi:hypothetical protein